MPKPTKPLVTRPIKVTELKVGMTVLDKESVRVNTMTMCTQPGKRHVNHHLCYDDVCTVIVRG